jgi:hypothetical protein
MKAYLFDEYTKEYVGEIEAQIDPLESKKDGKDIWLLPANASFELPLEPREGNKIIFDNGWKYEPIPEPEPEPQPTEEELKQARIAELQAYLDSTDWYVTRQLETGAVIPADVTKAREEARKEISTLRGGI